MEQDVRNKGRSASVCFTAKGSAATAVMAPPIATTATSPVAAPECRARPVSRTQSARLSNAGKSRRPVLTHHSADKDNYSGPSPGNFSRSGSTKRSVHPHPSPAHRRSQAYLELPKSASTAAANVPDEMDENSYRLRSFSFTSKGLVNRGDSFKRRLHGGRHDKDTNDSTTGANDKHFPTRPKTLDVGEKSPVFSYNVCVLGCPGVGKSSLISQFMTSECMNPYDREKGCPYSFERTISIMLNGEESELKFHECRSIKNFSNITYDAFILVYSVVDKSTFQHVEVELTKLHDNNILVTKPAILCGNKVDLARSRTVSTQDGKCLACTFQVKYTEISVDINHNVDELLVGILSQIRLKKEHSNDPANLQWYKSRGILRASVKARQMFTWIFGKEDSKFKNCENLLIL